MSVRRWIHCDRNGCNTHVQESLMDEAGFLTVTWSSKELQFCSTDCLVLHFGNMPPLVAA